MDASNSHLIDWINIHNVKVSSICSLRHVLISPQFPIRSIDIQDSQTDQTLFRIAAYCKNLTKLDCSSMEITSAFTDILSCNLNIQEIVLEGVTCFPWSASAFSDSLLQVDLSESSIVASEVFALLRNCPIIRALGLSKTDWSDEDIQTIVQLCPTISHIDVSKNGAITDTGIRHIAANLQGLKFLNCRRCPNITSKSLQYIAEGCGNTIETLHIDLSTPHHADTVLALAPTNGNRRKIL